MIGVVEEAIKYDTNGIEIKFLNDTERKATVRVSPRCYREIPNVLT